MLVLTSLMMILCFWCGHVNAVEHDCDRRNLAPVVDHKLEILRCFRGREEQSVIVAILSHNLSFMS